MHDPPGDIITVVLAVISAIGGQQAWAYYQRRLEVRKAAAGESREDRRTDAALYRDDLRARVDELSELLKQSTQKHDASQASREGLLEQMGELRSEVAALSVKVEHLEHENEDLRLRLAAHEEPPTNG